MPHVWGFFLTMHLGWESHVWYATKVLHQLLSPEGKRLVSKYIRVHEYVQFYTYVTGFEKRAHFAQF